MTLNIIIDNKDVLAKVVGTNDRHLLVFRQHLGYQFSILDERIVTDAPKEDRELLETIFNVIIDLAIHNASFGERDIIYIIKSIENGQIEDLKLLYKKRSPILLTDQGKIIYPKTLNQLNYINEIKRKPLVLGVGPAGTGKTYLAVAQAVSLLKDNKVKRIIVTRPAVEAGESLGFLPGDLKEKVDPYLIPIYDAFYEMLGKRETDDLIEKRIIEIAPLAYMRGRTLENAVVILDEAQNTTTAQMKMFLTRLGFQSKMIINGDPSQIDLKYGQKSGLVDAIEKLKGLNDVAVIDFSKIDVIRHPLVQKILERYEQSEN